MAVVHEKMKIYYHYYNNNKECPFKDQCIYAYIKKKENQCEIMYCMFKHDKRFQNNQEESDDENDESECNEISYVDVDTVRLADIEPVIAKVELTIEEST